MKSNKTITVELDGTQYTLEYNRYSVEQLEKQGVTIEDIQKTPLSTLPKLFAGAFIARHRFVKPAVVDEIFSRMGDKEQLLVKLAEMYSEPIETLLSEPSEKEKLNWSASW